MAFKSIALSLSLLPSFVFAQSPALQRIAKNVSASQLKKDLYSLAGDSMEGRMMGSRGDTMAARFIAASFKRAGVTAPYPGNSYFQTVSAVRYDDTEVLSFGGKNYGRFDGWQLFPNDPLKAAGMQVLVNNYQTLGDWNKHLPTLNLKDKAVLLTYDLFKDIDRVDSLEKALVARGALAVIWSGPHSAEQIGRRRELAFLPDYRQAPVFNETGPIHEVALTPDILRILVSADHLQVDSSGQVRLPAKRTELTLTTTISVRRDRKEVTVTAPNVIGLIAGTDPQAGAIILSAHHDHNGRNGKVIYYGAVDNASGSVAIMEIARLFEQARQAGLRPKRTIIVASWTGEERGMQGSFYYRDHPLIPLEKTYAVLNMDMLGRIDTIHAKAAKVNSKYAYILVKDTLHRELRKALFDANKSVGLTLDTYYEQPKYERRRVFGSDQYPFYEKNVPFVRIDCGFAKEYHMPEDTPDKIVYPLLAKQTSLAFLTLWNMAN